MTRSSCRVREIKCGFIERVLTDEVFHALAVVTGGNVARFTVVPLGTEVVVEGLERIQIRVATLAGTTIEAQTRINGLTTLDIGIACTSNSFTDRATRDNVFLYLNIKVDIRQPISVTALLLAKANTA